MKLLFDENLAPRLAAALQDLFPGSAHVGDVGLRSASDETVWSFAGRKGFTIVSKDSDFEPRAGSLGPPPKVVWIRLGNRPTSEVERILRSSVDDLHAFNEDSAKAMLVLR